jgi:hypothetical protein
MTNDRDIWRAEYAQTLYLRKAHDAVLDSRYVSLISNLWTTDQAGNAVALRSMERRKHILHLIFDVMLERSRRGTPLPGELCERALRDEATASYIRPKLKAPIIGGPGGLAKFGKRDHIRVSFDKGAFRVAPAGSYNGDPSLNSAQADQELQHFAVTANEHLLFKLHGIDADGKKLEFTPEPGQLFRYMDVHDFYVWCCGYGYDARLFYDFQADAVLLVRDQAAFTKRLLEAVEAAKPGMNAVHGPLLYYDPYTVRREQLRPIFCKNQKYLYQNEYRFAWTVTPSTMLAPFFVELGPLHDIAEFYELV